MPMFQPIVNTQPTAVGPSAPVRKGAGLDTLFEGLGSAIKVGASLFTEEQADPNQMYVSELERARLLREQGRIDESRAVVRRAGIELSRVGQNPGDEQFERTRELFGFDVDYGLPDDVQIENMIKETDEYQDAFLANLYSVNEQGAKTRRSLDEVEALAIAQAQKTIANRELLATNEQNSDIAVVTALDRINTQQNVVSNVITDIIESGSIPTREQMDQLQMKLNEMRNDINVQTSFASGDQRSKVKDAFNNVQIMFDTFKQSFGMQELSEDAQKNQLQAINNFLNDPSVTGKDKEGFQAAYNILTARDPQAYVNAMLSGNPEGLVNAFKALSKVGASNVSFAQKPTENGVRPLSNLALLAQEMANENDVLEALDVSKGFVALTGGSPDSLLNQQRADQVYTGIAHSAYTLGRLAETKDWVEVGELKAVFGENFIPYFNALSKHRPEMAQELYGIVQEQLAKYNTAVGEVVATQENAFGISYNEEGQLEVDLSLIYEQFGVEESVSKEFDALWKKYYATPEEMVRNKGRDMRNELVANPELLNDLNTAGFVQQLFESEGIANSDKATNMIQGAQYLGNIVQEMQKNYKNRKGMSIKDLVEMEPIMGLIDKGEGLGDYDKLFANAEQSRYAGTKVSQMTIQQAYNFGRNGYGDWVKGRNPRKKFATPMGRYQIVGKTMLEAANGLGLDIENTLFDANTQDTMFLWLAKKRFAEGGGDVDKTLEAMGNEWEAFKVNKTLRDQLRVVLEGMLSSNTQD